MTARSEALNDSITPSRQKKLGELTRFADELRPVAPSRHQSTIKKRSRDLGLDLLPEEIVVYAALEEPPQVQWFIKKNLPYNHDGDEEKESCRSPRLTLVKGSAHCFEGALFAYASNILNRVPSTRLVLMEARLGYDHNIVVYRDPQTKKWGCEEECGYFGSKGRKPKYGSIRTIVQSFTRNHKPSLLAQEYYRYSDPINLTARFGTEWITAPDSRNIYYHYIDQSVRFHPIFGSEEEPKYYPLVEALRNKWLVVGKRNRSEVAPENFPEQAQPLWNKYLDLMIQEPVDRAKIRRLAARFLKITGITPLALDEGIDDFQFYLREGYRPEELLTKMPKSKKSRTTAR